MQKIKFCLIIRKRKITKIEKFGLKYVKSIGKNRNFQKNYIFGFLFEKIKKNEKFCPTRPEPKLFISCQKNTGFLCDSILNL